MGARVRGDDGGLVNAALHLYLALRQKTCTLGIAGQFLR
jgi:hypothetical protein